jgi:solute carrier family 25 thiamine pyrophosphate transporter 19
MKIRFQVQLEPICETGGAIIRQRQLHSKYTSLHQAFVSILKEEGVRGLWRGTVPGQLLAIPYTAVQFIALDQMKTLAQKAGALGHPAEPFCSGAIAGAAGTVASYPFDLLRTTLAAQGEPKVYDGMRDAVRGICKESGIRGLYRGVGVTVLEIMPYAALQFGMYEAFLNAFDRMDLENRKVGDRNRKGRPEDQDGNSNGKTIKHFFSGLAAGTIAKLGTHPLDVAKKRFQVAGLARSMSYGRRVPKDVTSSLFACLRDIAKNEGIGGFYKGALPSVLKAAPAAAITLACYDFVLRALKEARDARMGTDRHHRKGTGTVGSKC